MRIRTPKNTGTLKNIGKFPSLKNKTTIWFESHLERDFIYLIEFDKKIVKYCEQPFKVNYHIDKKSHFYTPDFLLSQENKKQVIEVKPHSKTEKEEFKSFSNLITEYLAGQGYEYLVVTDQTIRIQPRLSNIKLLWYYARIPITNRHQVLVHELFCKFKEISFADFSSFLSQINEPRELVFSLLFHGYLVIDIDKQITANSLISRGKFN